MPTDPVSSAATDHCFTPSWCKCPDEPMCRLCKQGRCPTPWQNEVLEKLLDPAVDRIGLNVPHRNGRGAHDD